MNGETKCPFWRKAETGIHQAESKAAKREAFAHMELLRLQKEHRKRKIGERVKRIALGLILALAVTLANCGPSIMQGYAGTCPTCEGCGVTWRKCARCDGTGGDIYGEYCPVCDGLGVHVAICVTCGGTGKNIACVLKIK